MAGSSGPESAVKVRVAVTFTSTGYDAPNPIWRFCCKPGFELAGSPVTFTAGVVGSATVTVKLRVVVAPALSLTVTTMVAVAGADGVPEKTPEEERLPPAGSPVAVNVKGGTPPAAASVPPYVTPTVAAGRLAGGNRPSGRGAGAGGRAGGRGAAP